MKKKRATLKDIAYALNLSINTVSRSLRDCDDISAATKERVRQKAYEIGYLPSNVTDFIKRDNKPCVAVVVNTFKNLYFCIVCEKLLHLFKENGFDFTIIHCSGDWLDLDGVKQCISERVDGIITLLEPKEDAIDTAKLNKIPMLIIGRNVASDYVDQIYTNDELGGKLVANYLYNFHNVKNFAYISLPNAECSLRRQEAFLKTVRGFDPGNKAIVIECSKVDTEVISAINNGYTGFFCFSDEIAYNTLSILNNHVPNARRVFPHFHIVGYDGICMNIEGTVDLTTVCYDYDAICKAAVDIMKERLNDSERTTPKKSIVFPVSLHQRSIF